MNVCKLCGGVSLVKNGFNSSGNQRYKCRSCCKTFCVGDNRLKYDMKKRLKVMKMYLEGVGIRSIERIENVPNPLIIKWVRNFSNIIRKELANAKISKDNKNIEILELDELFTYCQKNSKEFTYGLLWTETGIKLLISK